MEEPPDPEISRIPQGDADIRFENSIAELIGRSSSVTSTPTPADLGNDAELERDLLEVISTAEVALKAVRGRAEVVQCLALMKEAEQEKVTRSLKAEQERMAGELSMFRQQLADQEERNRKLTSEVDDLQNQLSSAAKQNDELKQQLQATRSDNQLEALPDDIVLHIMEFLSPEDMSSFAQVCRRTRHLALEMDMQHVYDDKKRMEVEIEELRTANTAAKSPLLMSQRSPALSSASVNDGENDQGSAQKKRGFAPATMLSGLLGGRNASQSVDAGASRQDNILDHLKVEMFEAQIAYLGKQLKEMQEKVALAKSEADDATQRLSTAEATKEFLVEKMKDAESKVTQAESARNDAWELNKQLAESKDELLKRVEELEGEVAGLGTQSANQNTQQQADVEALKERVNVLEDLLGLAKADKDDAVAQLQGQKKILVKEVKALRSQLDEVKTERDRHLAALRHLEQQSAR